MREIKDHHTAGFGTLNNQIRIEVANEPDKGGASSKYQLSSYIHGQWQKLARIQFQRGPVSEVGPNGLTTEALLAICVDRLMSFQTGPFECKENMVAVIKIRDAMRALKERSRDRTDRCVEGQYKP